ncbi:bifunctional precorrin-2 dehydrogenase/sirohydrochlorin ferrochelatase [Paenibacillus sp. V4I5]|uniref:precorrin-2 dehydrogenase/sirohydrochlorin ferrochelatase family protein n=1 Tax=Paenibacillus sp. V4I5 TaxID=3042306 RepID=UPI00278F27CB|nr:bifunctional precorrin-2 dehydrogenase/sirohydrochlorin ferrochelatase [Paenibacillus sp. V4I5]MDQ0920014.1 precorrin-2 dehydrogenase/sirohydrochlorin ferrochelatase [Paenibacillus sp. V4I5]
MNHPYPIMMNLSGRRCLVVGGGAVAERKVKSLLQAGAHVTIVSAEFTKGLMEMENQAEVVLYRQPFDPSIMIDESADLVPYTLVVAATNVAYVNALVHEVASRQGKLVNVVDQPQLSSFIVPSVVRRGKLVIAVSTGGASPSAARKIAQELDNVYGEEYETYLDFLSDLRLLIQSRVADKQARQSMFKEMLEWDVLAKIREGTFESWKEKLYITLEKEPWMQG